MFKVTSRPLIGAGESSAIYKGAIKLPAPTARPTIDRPAIMPGTEGVTAWMTAPRMKAASARRTTRFRPRLSASIPDSGETIRAKSAVAEVMRDLSRVVKGWPRELLIETSVADITPVSSLQFC